MIHSFFLSKPFERIILVLQVILGGLLLYYFSLYAYSLLTTSLWRDELYTIDNFISKGVWFSMSHYPAPNNHVFFSALNAIIWDEGLFTPWKTRSVSLCAVVLGFVPILYRCYKEKMFSLGLLLCFVLTVDNEFLDLVLQSRAYGVVFLCISTLFFSFRSIADITNWKFVMLLFASVFSVYSLPILAVPVAFFWFWLFVLCWNSGLRGKIMLYGGGVALLTVLLHLPLFEQIYLAAKNYGGQWGEFFTSYDSVVDVFTSFMHFQEKDLWWLYSIVLIALFLNRKYFKSVRLPLFLLVLLFSIIIFLYMKTPIKRSVFFLSTIFVFSIYDSCATILAYYKRLFQNSYYKVGLILMMSMASVTAWENIKGYHFTPHENWKGLAENIENNFTSDIKVYTTYPERANHLQTYLSNEYEVVLEFDSVAFLNRELLFVDTDHRRRNTDLIERYLNDSKEIVVPQKRGGYKGIFIYNKVGTQ